MKKLASLALAILVTLLALYVVEVWLYLDDRDYRGRVARIAASRGVEMDDRTVAEVVDDLRARGVNAQPFFRLISRARDLMPVGNTPNRTIVFCNETGRYMVFRTDRHGFHNPDPLWDGEVDVVLLGDSFVQGACEPDGRDFANLLRADGLSVLNLGMGGNGPQLNLATLIEYAVPMRPKLVVWVHYAGNDLIDMRRHRLVARLREYVDVGASHDLIHRSDEVERLMEGFFESHGAEFAQNAEPDALLPEPGWQSLLRLPNLRRELGLAGAPRESPDFEYLARTVERAGKIAEEAGIDLAFVVLPSEAQLWVQPDGFEVEKTKEILSAKGAPAFDLTPVFRAAGEEAVYALGADGGHLSANGNRIVAEFLREKVLQRAD